MILFVIFANLMIAGASNGVNLTDGLDGLATGVSTMVFGAYVLISIWTYNQNCQTNPGIKCYEVRDSHDLALVAAAGMGACFGFLWWNATPAKIFMGDTGSLALGGALAGLAITTHTSCSSSSSAACSSSRRSRSMAQVASFKTTGKRVLRMAPLHHHFEMVGWNEVTVVVRFWIIAGSSSPSGSASSTPSGWWGRNDLRSRPTSPARADPPGRRLVRPPTCSSSASACPGSPPPTRSPSVAPR